MPAFDLRGIRIGKYTNTNGTVSYSEHESIGDAMECNLELKFAEGRLYAESTLSEYMKRAIGGTISIAEKYIPDDAQVVMYGAAKSSRSVGDVTVNGMRYGAKDQSNYVGVVFYAPDMIDGVEKYTCVFVSRCLFGAPAMSYKTKGDSIEFKTPTTTGEFLADHSANKVFIETGIAASEAEAIAWCQLVLGET